MNLNEMFIMNFYQSLNVHEPSSLSEAVIVEHLNIELIYWKNTSAFTKYNSKCFMFINENLNKQQQWQEFGHEMSHYFFDQQDKKLMFSRFVDYCETKADYFAYHFCVPTFMLQKLKGVDVYDVMELFNVEFEFALRRLEMYRNNV